MLQKSKNYFVVIIVIIFLTGCNETSPGYTDSEISLSDIKNFHIVEMVHEDRLLIGSTYYSINKDTKLKKSDRSDLHIDEIQQGDLVYFEAHDQIMLSFPGQGWATEVVLQNDEESKKVSENIRHFIENQKTGDILSIRIEKLSHESIKLDFYEREVHGKKFEAVIDRLTNKFVVTEIPNEEALEQDRISREMAEAHPEGSTSGHITEIYEDGFRVNMSDYTFAKDVQFTNDSGKTISKDKFKIGSFVSVDYDVLKREKIIGEGIMSKLVLLEKENIQDVQSWIESVVNGNEFKEAAILMSYKDLDGSYVIRVADLLDNSYDTFELKYDVKSGTHTTRRNVHKK